MFCVHLVINQPPLLIHLAASIDTFSRLHWYRGGTVLLHAGLGYWEVLEFSKQILLLRQLAIVSALSTSNGEEEYNSSTHLTLLQTHQ